MNLLKIRKISQEKGIALRKLAIASDMTEQNLHRCIKSNKITANDLEKIAEALEVPVSTFFDESNFANNQYGDVSGGTVVQSRDGNIQINSNKDVSLKDFMSLKVINDELVAKNRDFETKTSYYWELVTSLVDKYTEIYVKIVEENPQMKEFLAAQKETNLFIAQINTLIKVSDNNIFFNKKFFEYFKNPYQ